MDRELTAKHAPKHAGGVCPDSAQGGGEFGPANIQMHDLGKEAALAARCIESPSSPWYGHVTPLTAWLH
eukprot:CAMPEP_0172748870 /NCGR_PEP_ID=MMETSP1074-20121228/146014_1 /TAXON_ID=2916 /ORGANISM="Ceratium fusus, Strain PA161109" /LENGTH=68 /DNA_ID=CAMNT_0013580695 /DNA_START=545 /DNA_END=752 /DNA_ORIENTATION=+